MDFLPTRSHVHPNLDWRKASYRRWRAICRWRKAIYEGWKSVSKLCKWQKAIMCPKPSCVLESKLYLLVVRVRNFLYRVSHVHPPHDRFCTFIQHWSLGSFSLIVELFQLTLRMDLLRCHFLTCNTEEGIGWDSFLFFPIQHMASLVLP